MKKIKKVQDGIWKTDSESKPYQIDFRPNGHHGKRYKKSFLTLGETRRFMNHLISENNGLKEWQPDTDDNRKLSTIIDLWHKLHGKNLIEEKALLQKLKNMCKGLNDPIARKLTPKVWVAYRAIRLEKVCAKTVNEDQNKIKGVFNELIRLGELKTNPLNGLKNLKYSAPEMGFFSKNEMMTLLNELKNSDNIDAYYISKICLSTGARWGEAEKLLSRNLRDNFITFIKTKNGKTRIIPISDELKNEIPEKEGRLFSDSMKTFRTSLAKTGITLPKGQATHALRHTFASHFMMNGGNILVLKEILGHARIEETMKYAHFCKTHLHDAVMLNPISK
ncbi:phage integrase [Colwellia psychrerythraea]|uniref:Site-specific recombinase, phage integrase family n=1 Tax=Colwellia psychrerythraea (strain 34H / ATCC BAA-681) TaxID=167879 RepID=Q487W6_COLP3|nr:tyrosine-type recombinase/integrase [Colwellia psychrerythraea]AAZ27394.1 site-specific recombinase, phage integrase family [Colwellia psychrerythraea 34H]